MQEGLTQADREPITEEELMATIQALEKDPAIKAIERMDDLPPEYIQKTFLNQKAWSGFRMYINNNIRVPFK